MLEKCELCPHLCKVDRNSGKKGFCNCDDKIKIAKYSLHYYEEPCISGENGSGTVFFSNCNLKCKYCQNYKISSEGKGYYISIEELANIFLELEGKGANNINLVTPTMYVYQIIQAIKMARKNGLSIPIVYNSNGYENVDTIKLLDGYIDVYLPDLKYSDDLLAKTYSNINNYFEISKKAILEMYKQVGAPILDENGIIKRGLIIRHLILPNFLDNSKNVLEWIRKNINEKVYVSVMAQYFPCYLAKDDKYLNRKLSEEEYEEMVKFIELLDFKNGYMQDLEDDEEQYVPDF